MANVSCGSDIDTGEAVSSAIFDISYKATKDGKESPASSDSSYSYPILSSFCSLDQTLRWSGSDTLIDSESNFLCPVERPPGALLQSDLVLCPEDIELEAIKKCSKWAWNQYKVPYVKHLRPSAIQGYAYHQYDRGVWPEEEMSMSGEPRKVTEFPSGVANEDDVCSQRIKKRDAAGRIIYARQKPQEPKQVEEPQPPPSFFAANTETLISGPSEVDLPEDRSSGVSFYNRHNYIGWCKPFFKPQEVDPDPVRRQLSQYLSEEELSWAGISVAAPSEFLIENLNKDLMPVKMPKVVRQTAQTGDFFGQNYVREEYILVAAQGRTGIRLMNSDYCLQQVPQPIVRRVVEHRDVENRRLGVQTNDQHANVNQRNLQRTGTGSAYCCEAAQGNRKEQAKEEAKLTEIPRQRNVQNSAEHGNNQMKPTAKETFCWPLKGGSDYCNVDQSQESLESTTDLVNGVVEQKQTNSNSQVCSIDDFKENEPEAEHSPEMKAALDLLQKLDFYVEQVKALQEAEMQEEVALEESDLQTSQTSIPTLSIEEDEVEQIFDGSEPEVEQSSEMQAALDLLQKLDFYVQQVKEMQEAEELADADGKKLVEEEVEVEAGTVSDDTKFVQVENVGAPAALQKSNKEKDFPEFDNSDDDSAFGEMSDHSGGSGDDERAAEVGEAKTFSVRSAVTPSSSVGGNSSGYNSERAAPKMEDRNRNREKWEDVNVPMIELMQKLEEVQRLIIKRKSEEAQEVEMV